MNNWFIDPNKKSYVNLDSPEEARKQFLDGKLSVDADKEYELVDENGNSAGAYKGSDLGAALKSGLYIPSAQKESDIRYQRENEGALGNVKTFAGSALDTATFGLPSLVSDEFDKKQQLLSEVNPISSGLGTAAGIAGNVALTQGIGLGGLGARAGLAAERAIAGSGTVSKILGGAAKLGTQGLVESAPWTVTDALKTLDSDNPELTGETVLTSLLLNGGIGAVLGASGRALDAGADSSLKAYNRFIYGKEAANTATFKSLLTSSNKKATKTWDEYNKGEGAIGDMLQKKGLRFRDLKDGNSNFGKEDWFDVINQEQKKVGNQLSAEVERLRKVDSDDMFKLYKEFGDDVFKNKGKIDDELVVNFLNKTAPNDVGGVGYQDFFNKFETDVLLPLEDTMIGVGKSAKLRRVMDNAKESIDNDIYKRFKEVFDQSGIDKDKAVQLIRQSNAKISLGNMIDQERAVNKAFKNIHNTDLSDSAEQLGTMKKVFKDFKENIIESSGESASELKRLNKEYRNLDFLSDLGVEEMGKMKSNDGLGLINSIVGGGAVAGTILSGNPAGLLGLAAPHAIKAIRNNYSGLVSKYGNDASAMEAEISRDVFGKKVVETISKLSNKISQARTPIINSFYQLLKDKNVDIGVQDGENKDSASYREILSSLQSNRDGGSVISKQLSQGLKSMPNTYSAAANAEDRLTNYLLNELPKDNTQGKLFNKKEYVPSKFEQQKWIDKYVIAMNPYKVLDKIQDQTLNVNHVKTIKYLYPQMFEGIKQEIVGAGGDWQNQPLTPKQKNIISLMTENKANIDGNTSNINVYQQSYSKENKEKVNKASGNITIPGSEYTELQRITL